MDELMNCPRCDSAAVSILAESPVADCWMVYGCGICWFSWRSTEQWLHENDRPDKLDPTTFADLLEMPALPPLRRAEGDAG